MVQSNLEWMKRVAKLMQENWELMEEIKTLKRATNSSPISEANVDNLGNTSPTSTNSRERKRNCAKKRTKNEGWGDCSKAINKNKSRSSIFIPSQIWRLKAQEDAHSYARSEESEDSAPENSGGKVNHWIPYPAYDLLFTSIITIEVGYILLKLIFLLLLLVKQQRTWFTQCVRGNFP